MEKRLMIGVPVNRGLSPKFNISIQKLVHYLIVNNWTVDMNYNNGTVLSSQRNKIMKEAYNEKMNLLFIDSDMIFTSDDFKKVYNAADDKQLTGAMCFMRRFPFQPAVFSEDRVEEECVFTGMKLGDIPIYPFRCAAVGCAFLFIPWPVIGKIYEHFKFPFNHVEMSNGQCLGEDLSFFHRCNKIGIETYCVSNVEIGHLTERIIYRKDHEAALQMVKREATDSSEDK